MIHKIIANKKIMLILCFVIFFSLLNPSCSFAWGKDDESKITNKLLSQLTVSLLSFGDGLLHLVSASVGETITIDRLVFNKVNKVSVDYWDDLGSTGTSSQESVKKFMQPVIQKWYPVFFKIATMVYMIVLVYIGIAILLSSTAEKKANYKQLFTTWFVGITILFMFPYVMKYIIIINDAFVKTLYASAYSQNVDTATLANADFGVTLKYGKPEFATLLGNQKSDVMALTRDAAQKNKENDIAITIMYLILIGQTIAVLIMYYKRAFMLAFLITIFPLVAMTYVLDKIGDGKNQTFGKWFKEFIVNVIVQMFHATVYLLVTGMGIKLYIEKTGSYFIFTIMCIWFLFEGEKILRTIFNVNSNAKSMGDIAASGALALGAVKSGAKLLKKQEDNGSAEDNKDVNQANTRLKNRSNRQKENNQAAIEGVKQKKENGESTVSHGEYQGENKEPEGVSTPKYDGETAKDTLLGGAMKRRLAKGFASKTVKFGAGALGATLATSKNLADGNTDVGKAITAFSAGKSFGQTLATPLTAGVNKLEQLHEGHKLSKQIKSGALDEQLGINNIPAVIPIGGNEGDVDLSNVEGTMDDRQKIYREALAQYAKVAARSGRTAAEIAYYEYLEKNSKK